MGNTPRSQWDQFSNRAIKQMGRLPTSAHCAPLPRLLKGQLAFSGHPQKLQAPPNSIIFTADATSMCSNVNADHAMEVFKKWFKLHEQDLPDNFPVAKILLGLDIVMRNNVFMHGNCFYRQENGTAMGTSCACAYATIHCSHHEEMCLLKMDEVLLHE